MSFNLLLMGTVALTIIFLLMTFKVWKEIDKEYKECERQANIAFEEMRHGVTKQKNNSTAENVADNA